MTTSTYYQNAGQNFDPALNLKTITSRIRVDARQLAKTFPIVKAVSVRMRHHSAIDCVVSFVEGVELVNPRWADSQANWNPSERPEPLHTERVREVLKAVETIRDSYNYNNSDLMTDYFDVGYYGSTNADSSQTIAAEKVALDAAQERKASRKAA